MPLLELKNLVKEYRIAKGFFSAETHAVRAVNGVSFALEAGETLGLVGESGCGKTTTGRVIARLVGKTSGDVLFDGTEIFSHAEDRMQALRRDIQIIFQDPFASLNPRMRVGDSIAEGMEIHRMGNAAARRDRVAELLAQVGLSPADAGRYPHEFSGGQRQRVGIARALATRPRLLIADEPVSALDVSIQAQILNLLEDLQKEMGFAMIFIAHDLRVVAHLSRRIAVMYAGRIVELAESQALVREPLHPYTRALLSAIPWPDPTLKNRRQVLAGEPPNPFAIPPGCPFHPRCPKVMPKCLETAPVWRAVRPGRWTECYLYEEQGIVRD